MNKIKRNLSQFILMAFLFPSLSFGLAEERFGAGLILGGPSGVSINYMLSDRTSVDGALGTGLGDRDLHVHLTFLLHDPNSMNLGTRKLGWYLGGGARFASRDRDNEDDDSLFGVRGSIGLRCPLEIQTDSGNEFLMDFFGELAPVLNLTDDVGMDLDLAIGARYYF